MFSGKLKAWKPCAVILLAMAGVLSCAAQYGQEPSDAGAKRVLTTQYVKTGLFVISSEGGNTVLRLSGNGLILIDGQQAANFDELLHRVKKIVDEPIRVMINTDHYVEHTGTNGKFLEQETQVVAQQNVKQNLIGYSPSSGKITPPSNTYDRDLVLHFGAVEVQLLHYGNARTDGDTVVYFPNLKAVAVGDIYSSNPVPDYSAGGSLAGWSQVLSQILKLDFDVAIPGKGPTVSRGDLEALKAKVDTLLSRATELVKKGVPKDQLMARLESGDPGWKPSLSEEQLDRFYAEMSGVK